MKKRKRKEEKGKERKEEQKRKKGHVMSHIAGLKMNEYELLTESNDSKDDGEGHHNHKGRVQHVLKERCSFHCSLSNTNKNKQTTKEKELLKSRRKVQPVARGIQHEKKERI